MSNEARLNGTGSHGEVAWGRGHVHGEGDSVEKLSRPYLEMPQDSSQHLQAPRLCSQLSYRLLATSCGDCCLQHPAALGSENLQAGCGVMSSFKQNTDTI